MVKRMKETRFPVVSLLPKFHKFLHRKKTKKIRRRRVPPAAALDSSPEVGFDIDAHQVQNAEIRHFPPVFLFEASHHEDLINNEPLIPIPHHQTGADCFRHASVNCLEIRERSQLGGHVPRLSVQHALNSGKKNSELHKWLVEHGVTEEAFIEYFGEQMADNFVPGMMPTHHLAEMSERFVDNGVNHEDFIHTLKNLINSDKAFVGGFYYRCDFPLDGERIYRAEEDFALSPQGLRMGHAVVVVGWGKERVTGEECWVYLNSKGRGFGYEEKGLGIMYMKRTICKAFRLTARVNQ